MLTKDGSGRTVIVTDIAKLDRLGYEVVDEALRATRKHQLESMTAPGHPAGKRLGILTEEVGEAAEEALMVRQAMLTAGLGRVGRRTTYDNGSAAELRKELVQVAAMALSWVYALDEEGEAGVEQITGESAGAYAGVPESA